MCQGFLCDILALAMVLMIQYEESFPG